MESPDQTGPPADPFAGTEYRMIRQLGSGGMGNLYLVRHTEIGREFAAKVLQSTLAGNAALLHRMRIEAQTLGAFDHKNIVSVKDFGVTHDSLPFIVMEFLRGRSLREEVAARGKLPVLEAVSYACELLSALSAAHAIGIVHRDVKPDNLFICSEPGSAKYLKVLDFGIARVLPGSTMVEPLPAGLQTGTGVVVGTPRFVSPEAARGLRVDARADVYAAALVLYFMLVGRGPFDHIRTDSKVLSAHADQDPQPPSHFSEEPIARELDRVVLRALAKTPDERFQTADAFREALADVGERLREPAGSLETTTFDAELVRRSIPAAGTHAPQTASASRSLIETASEDSLLSAEPPRPSNIHLIGLFMLAMLLAALVFGALVFLVRGTG